MSDPITTQPQPATNINENPNSEPTDTFLNVSQNPEVLQPLENEVIPDGEERKKKKNEDGCCDFCANCNDDSDFTILDLCACLAWCSNAVTECVQCCCIGCCQCLGDFVTECGSCDCDCGDCDCDCGDCDCNCGDCDCDCGCLN